VRAAARRDGDGERKHADPTPVYDELHGTTPRRAHSPLDLLSADRDELASRPGW
jgi:hypothetical protein